MRIGRNVQVVVKLHNFTASFTAGDLDRALDLGALVVFKPTISWGRHWFISLKKSLVASIPLRRMDID
jgi:hypothetical protein